MQGLLQAQLTGLLSPVRYSEALFLPSGCGSSSISPALSSPCYSECLRGRPPDYPNAGSTAVVSTGPQKLR